MYRGLKSKCEKKGDKIGELNSVFASESEYEACDSTEKKKKKIQALNEDLDSSKNSPQDVDIFDKPTTSAVALDEIV
ncbi:unnamed protein product, partial [Brachionus calyciflorus]